MTRILLADDQSEVRAGMRALLESEPDLEVVGEASDGLEAVALARRRKADIVVMDVRMPRMDGIEATRVLTGAHGGAATEVLVVTTFDIDEYVFGALQAGAAGFLLKETAPEQLVLAIRALVDGHGLVAPAVTRRLIAEYIALAPSARPDDALEALTARELEVLQLMARGLSNADIADTLGVGESTIKSHVTSILAKLGLRSRVQAVIYAYEQRLVRLGRR